MIIFFFMPIEYTLGGEIIIYIYPISRLVNEYPAIMKSNKVAIKIHEMATQKFLTLLFSNDKDLKNK